MDYSELIAWLRYRRIDGRSVEQGRAQAADALEAQGRRLAEEISKRKEAEQSAYAGAVRLAEIELSRDSWKREAEMNQEAADKAADYAARLAEAEREIEAYRELALARDRKEDKRLAEAERERDAAWSVGRAHEEELDRLRARLAEAESAIQHAANALRGEGVEDQGEAFDIAARILDAFLTPPPAPGSIPAKHEV